MSTVITNSQTAIAPERPAQAARAFDLPNLESPEVWPQGGQDVQRELGENLVNTQLKGVAKLAKYASFFEFGKSALCTLITKGDAAYLTYTLCSLPELIGNMFLAEETKHIPEFILKPLAALAKVFGITNSEGKMIQSAAEMESQSEEVLGALTFSGSAFGFLYNALKFWRTRDEREETPSQGSKLGALTSAALSFLNTGMMEMSYSAKSHIATTARDLIENPSDQVKEKINTAWVASRDDLLCGLESASLVPEQLARVFFGERVGRWVEGGLAAVLSVMGMKVGIEGMRGDEEAQGEPLAIEGTAPFKALFNFTRNFARKFDLDILSWDEHRAADNVMNNRELAANALARVAGT